MAAQWLLNSQSLHFSVTTITDVDNRFFSSSYCANGIKLNKQINKQTNKQQTNKQTNNQTNTTL